MTLYAHYSEVPDWRWRSFKPYEMACHAASTVPDDRGALLVDEVFMDRLQALRDLHEAPLIVTSGYRTPEHNAAVSSTGHNGPHTTGRAVDIKATPGTIIDLVAKARSVGFCGFGIAPKKGFLHLDIARASCVCWTYQ